MMVSLFLGVVFFFFGGPIVALYNDDPMIVAEGAKMLMIVATQPLQSSQFILGALRGAGDMPPLTSPSSPFWSSALCWPSSSSTR